ncbi:hypothetical protein AMECASPLE_037835 [Ameca splendens]|uniref:Uncharacterized protein n=1 Tax=Ameca splendens TaxID=208324 RepID=A0ABV0Z5W9_9TELE
MGSLLLPPFPQLLERAFNEGEKKVRKLEKHINDFMDLGKNTDEVSQKVEQHNQSAFQDLQLALYHKRIRDHVLKISDQKYTNVKTEDLMKNLQSECCWLGQLLALNNPPLQPDWENHIPEMDAWHILPRNFRVIKKKTGTGVAKLQTSV